MATDIIPYEDQTGTWSAKQRSKLQELYTNVSWCNITKLFYCTNDESPFKT